MKIRSLLKPFLSYLFILLTIPQIGTAREIRPESSTGEQTLIISGNKRAYHQLKRSKDLQFELKGPQRVRVISRVVVPENTSSHSYRVEYQVDENTPRQFDTETQPSPVVSHAERTTWQIGQSKSMYLNVPEGRHIYRFRLPGTSDDTIFLRMIAAKMTQMSEDETAMVRLLPDGEAEQVVLLYHETPLRYFRITEEDYATVTVRGPTYLRVYSRLEFEYWMEGEVDYRIVVKKEDQVEGTYQMTGERSETTVYRDNGELVPGKWRRFRVKVPKGEHTYYFHMSDDRASALIKILLPEDGELDEG